MAKNRGIKVLQDISDFKCLTLEISVILFLFCPPRRLYEPPGGLWEQFPPTFVKIHDGGDPLMGVSGVGRGYQEFP